MKKIINWIIIALYVGIAVFALMYTGSASALELNPFANIKTLEPVVTQDTPTYLKDDFNTDYGIIKISKTIFWIESDKLAEYSLTYNTKYCLINCEARGKAILYQDGKLFDDLRFIDEFGKEKFLDAKYYLKGTEQYTRAIPIYKEVCKFDLKNNTDYCDNVVAEYKYENETYEVWNEYKGETLKADSYEWKILGKKLPTESVDFIPIARGEVLSEWAWWNSSATKVPITINTNGLTFDENQTIFFSFNLSNTTKFGSDFNRTFIVYQDTTEIARDIVPQGSNNASIRFRLQTAVSSNNDNNYSLYFVPTADGSPKKTLKDVYWMGDHFDESAFNNTYWNLTTGPVTIVQANSVINVTSANKGLIATKGYFYPNVTVELNASLPNTYTWIMGIINGSSSVTSLDSGMRASVVIAEIGGGSVRLGYNYDGTTSYTDHRHVGFSIIKFDLNATTSSFINETGSITTLAVGLTPAPPATYGVAFNPQSSGGMWELADYVKAYKNDFRYTLTTGAEQTQGGGMGSITMTSTFNYPVAFYNTTDTTPDLSCNFTSSLQNITAVNITIYDSGKNLDYTNTEALSSGIESYNKTWTTSALGDDYYNWTCIGYGNQGVNATTTNRTFTIDTTKPLISISSPANNTEVQTIYNNASVTLNVSISDIHLSSCWYYNGTGNTTFTCGTNITTNLTNGKGVLTFFINDSFGNTNQTSWSYLINKYSYTYYLANQSVENSVAVYGLNVTADSISSIFANLSFNGTNYTMTQSSNNGTLAVLTKSVTTPTVSNDTLYFVWFNYTLNTIMRGTGIYNQTIQNIGDVGTNCTNPSLFFRLLDEETDAPVTATFDYNFQYGVTNMTEKTTYGTASGSTLSICVNTTISPNYTVGYGEIAYTASGYNTRRYYVYTGTILNNVTQNITIYDLASTSQTTFQLEVKDTTQTAMSNKYTSLIRWYPDLNEYRNVDMGKTDEDGNTIIHVDAEDTDYKIAIYETNGTLLKLSESIRMYCTATPCVYSFIVGESVGTPWNILNNITSLNYGLSFNKTLKLVSFIYNDTNANFNNSRLWVQKVNNSGSYLSVCNITNTSSVGIIRCNLSTYTEGDFIARAYNTRGTAEKLAHLLRFDISSIVDTFGLEGLFLGWFIILTAAMIFLANKIAGLVAVDAAFLLVRLIGFIEFGALFLFAVIGISVILIVIFKQEGTY